MDELYVRVKGGGEICVPASSMSAYVLLEQEDWFEKEIAFVRRMLRPGMRVIDIGANYGTYTLAMARAVGLEGKPPACRWSVRIADGPAEDPLWLQLANRRHRLPYTASLVEVAPPEPRP